MFTCRITPPPPQKTNSPEWDGIAPYRIQIIPARSDCPQSDMHNTILSLSSPSGQPCCQTGQSEFCPPVPNVSPETSACSLLKLPFIFSCCSIYVENYIKWCAAVLTVGEDINTRQILPNNYQWCCTMESSEIFPHFKNGYIWSVVWWASCSSEHSCSVIEMNVHWVVHLHWQIVMCMECDMI